MQDLLRLCLWQAIIIGILSAHFPVNAEEERGIRMRGPKSSDVFPYDRYGPITSKDTLWNIATRIRPDKRLSVYQVMQALYQENPQAFLDSNINYLVEGQYLKIPSFNNMMAINTNSAKKKSVNDSKAWKKAQPKSPKKAVFIEPSVKKKDLEEVKTEINDQLQKIDGQQQERLEHIQNDISDSIDGLQAILKENDDLRQRLTSFNDKLGIMQDEVAKGKEIKLQMDDMIQLQQALLAKAEAREKELLLERQQAALAEQDIMSSLWFKIVMGTMPAVLILLLLAFLFKRRKQASDEVFFNELESKKQASTAKKESVADELSLDDELNLDDELDLSLDDELNLDDELDLSLDDELNLDGEFSLDDDLSIDLIESEDDNLDDLEDILLDDDSDDDILDGGELEQGDLDSLLSGLDDEAEEPASEELEGGELSQDDLNDLLGGLDDLVDEELAIEESMEDNVEAGDVTDPDDIDALLNSVSDSMNDSVSDSENDSADVTDPDDIDALLESISGNTPTPQQVVKQDLPEEISQSTLDVEKDSTLSPEDLKIQNEKAENEAKISAFTAEYVTPFLTADFTDVIAKDSDAELASDTLISSDNNELDDELDIDALIADTISKDEKAQSLIEDGRDDVGDNLTRSSIGETINTQVESGFTEAELSQLLADESLEGDTDQAAGISAEEIVLSPDFTDEDVLAELLADMADSDEEQLEDADELDVIEELANVDFDELLANIEEESATTSTEHDDIELTLGDIGDDLIDDILVEEKIQSAQDTEPTENYVSVDDLISDSLDEGDISEPYERTNIDVGLGQFSQNESGVDVDEDGSMSSKLDLAKMYIEMSDEENAQVILQEVISKGDTTQQVEAQALLDSL